MQPDVRNLLNFSQILTLVLTMKVIGIKQNISNSIIEKCQENSVFLPSTLSKNRLVFFAIDNTDLKIGIFDGRNQLYGTAIAVYQTTSGDKKHEIKAHLLLHFISFQGNKCKLISILTDGLLRHDLYDLYFCYCLLLLLLFSLVFFFFVLI